MGLICVAVSHALFAYYCPFFDGEAPRWVYVFAAVALFSYQTLDNLDGKQARRTGSSSPLGLLFDHGCDALNVSVGTMTMFSVIQVGTTWKALAFFLSAQSVFFCATWEEYYSGLLSLPIINGPTEGILVGVFLKLLTAFMGPAFWKFEYIPGLQNNTVFVLATVIASIPTIGVKYVYCLFAFNLPIVLESPDPRFLC
jgi:ethanolaminephosphotransferase